jgi:predicted secreted protein
VSFGSFVAIYFVIWWVALFAVLPWGIRSQAEEGEVVPGTDPGAPKRPRFLFVIVVTTLLSLVVFGIFYAITLQEWVGLEDFDWLPGGPRR